MTSKVQIVVNYGLLIFLDVIDAASRMFCLSIGHAIRNIAQNIPCGAVADRLRKAVRSLEVPEDEFFQFTEETKAR